MKFQTESEINGPAAKELRESMKANLKDFWGAICVTKPSARAYEGGRVAMPAYIKRLFFLHYCLGFPTDITTEEFDATCGVAFVSNFERTRDLERGLIAARDVINETLQGTDHVVRQ